MYKVDKESYQETSSAMATKVKLLFFLSTFWISSYKKKTVELPDIAST